MEPWPADKAIGHAARLPAAIAVLAIAVTLQTVSFSQNSTFPSLTTANDRESALLIEQTGGAQADTSLGTLPASFSGDFACAGCAGIRYQLNLFPDHVFLSRMVDQGNKGAADDMGTWQVTKDGRTVVLTGRQGAVEKFAMREGGTLRELPGGGPDSASKTSNDLHRSEKFTALDSGVTLSGMYLYFADSTLFRECTTGKRWPVASEQDSLALQTAYMKARQKPQQELLVIVQGQLAPPAQDGR